MLSYYFKTEVPKLYKNKICSGCLTSKTVCTFLLWFNLAATQYSTAAGSLPPSGTRGEQVAALHCFIAFPNPPYMSFFFSL